VGGDVQGSRTMDVLVVFLLLIVSLTGAFSILVHWLEHGARRRTRQHPIARRGQTAAFGDRNGSFVQMPDHLKTHEEMVAWMTRELPDLIAKTWTAK
jgi:hypothetical protein